MYIFQKYPMSLYKNNDIGQHRIVRNEDEEQAARNHGYTMWYEVTIESVVDIVIPYNVNIVEREEQNDETVWITSIVEESVSDEITTEKELEISEQVLEENRPEEAAKEVKPDSVLQVKSRRRR
jgi:hypothetical protein